MNKKKNPLEIFNDWFQEAQKTQMEEPTAMNLSTVGENGFPSSRIVLLKDYSKDGFTFYTNMTSRKAQEIQQNPQVSLSFYWMPMSRQIRIEGKAVQVDDASADEYFASRPRESQIGAWASKQSKELQSMLELEKAVAKYALKFHIGKIPRPDFWSGFTVIPHRIEFWQKRDFRLHERVTYEFENSQWNESWNKKRLFP